MNCKGLSLVKLFVLALAVATALPASSFAETVRGKFTLNSETHWGTAILPAGSYEFSFERSHLPTIVLVRKASGEPVAMLVSSSTSAPISDSADELHLLNRSDGVFVSSLTLGAAGLEMSFQMPKAREVISQTAKQQPAAVPGFAQ